MNKLILFFMIVFLIANICSNCEEGQIDINSASASELEELDGVGEKISQYIIDEQPFDSVDELIEVYRIGEVTLEKIKKQGLACVNDDEEDNEKEDEKKETKKKLIIEEEVAQKNKTTSVVTGEVIELGAQNIKSEGFLQRLDVSNYAIYGFVIFSILLGLLFVLKLRLRNKDEIE